VEKLTEDFVSALPANGKDRIVFDITLPSFGIRVTAAGKKLFIARAKFDDTRRYVALGDFPRTKVAKARNDARRVLDAIREGRDPLLDRAARVMAAKAKTWTVADLGERWMAEIVTPKRKPRTASDYRRILDQKILPTFGDTTVAGVVWADVNKWHSKMKDTPRRANYALAVFKALLNYGEKVGLRAPHTNPCTKIEMFREGRRERFLSQAEMAKAAQAITSAELDGINGPHASAGLRLAMFTGARSGELLASKWSDIDWERRFIRLMDSKTNDARTIHLNDAAVEILKTLPRVGPYIVAGAVKGEAYRSLTRAWVKCRGRAGLDDVRLHDLRHSYASLAASKGISLQMIGMLLGHKVPATTARYAHLARDAAAGVNDQLGAAMTAAIAMGPPRADNVVKLKPKRRRPDGR